MPACPNCGSEVVTHACTRSLCDDAMTDASATLLPKWLIRSREVIEASKPFKVGSLAHLLEMAVAAYEQAATPPGATAQDVHLGLLDDLDHEAKLMQGKRVHALGAAISRRDWHAVEQAHAAIRDAAASRDVANQEAQAELREENERLRAERDQWKVVADRKDETLLMMSQRNDTLHDETARLRAELRDAEYVRNLVNSMTGKNATQCDQIISRALARAVAAETERCAKVVDGKADESADQCGPEVAAWLRAASAAIRSTAPACVTEEKKS